MFHIRDEIEPVRNGFNFYPLSNRVCRGFVFKAGRFCWSIRWNRRSGLRVYDWSQT